MESEKVKEIKECLEEFKDDRIGYYTNGIDRFMLTKEDTLALINELESENERLKHLNNSISLGADLHAESYQQEITELDKENQQLKDRIAELENTDYYKEIEKKKEELLCKEYSLIKYEKEIAGKYLKEFARKLKECAQTNLDHFTGFQKVILTEQIDELLKEYEKWQNKRYFIIG